MRNTVQRTMILNTVKSMKNHPTADEVYEKVLKVCPGISKGTVYRDLNVLAEKGEILRVNIANAPDRFDLTNYNHAHCICSCCKKVFDYKFKSLPELSDNENENFLVSSYEIIVYGICKNCQQLNGGR